MRDKHILVLLAGFGHAAQEALKPAALLERLGCQVTFATLDAVSVRFDPLCNAIALFEALWDPTFRLLLDSRGRGRLRGLPQLRRLAAAGMLEPWLDGFDAVIVPGGHGAVLDAFMRDPLVVDTVARFYWSERPVGLICHAPFVAALSSTGHPPIVPGKTVTSWPRSVEALCGLLPVIGRYLMPYGSPVSTLLHETGATVLDSILPWQRVHAVADGTLVTGRGPWSTAPFTCAFVSVLAATASSRAKAPASPRVEAPASRVAGGVDAPVPTAA